MKNNINQATRGFTLIELLVVIAIIGILASVVLASLNSARDKGSDAASRGALAQLRTQAEIFYDGSRSYNGFCASAPAVAIIENARVNSRATTAWAAGSADVTAVSATTAACNDNATAWAAAVPLKSNGTYYCVDSLGLTGTAASLAAGDTTCS